MAGFVALTGATWSAGSTVNPVVVTVATPPGQGNTLVAGIKISSGGSNSSVTDPRGNTWSRLVFAGGGGANADSWFAYVRNAYQVGDQIKFNLSVTDNSEGVAIAEFSGISSTNPADIGLSAHGGSSLGPSATTATAPEVAVAIYGQGNTNSVANGNFNSPFSTIIGNGVNAVAMSWLALPTRQTVSCAYNGTGVGNNGIILASLKVQAPQIFSVRDAQTMRVPGIN